MKLHYFFPLLFAAVFVVPLFSGCRKDDSKDRNGTVPDGAQVHRYTQLTDANYEEFLAKTSGVVLVDFDADWCGWCRKMDSGMAKLNSAMGDKVKIVKIDFDTNPVARQKFKVRGIPALFLYKDGELKDACLG